MRGTGSKEDEIKAYNLFTPFTRRRVLGEGKKKKVTQSDILDSMISGAASKETTIFVRKGVLYSIE